MTVSDKSWKWTFFKEWIPFKQQEDFTWNEKFKHDILNFFAAYLGIVNHAKPFQINSVIHQRSQKFFEWKDIYDQDSSDLKKVNF